MAKFNSGFLKVLDRIYRFTGDSRIGRNFETSVPIQPVRDLSREAELGAAYGPDNGVAAHLSTLSNLGAVTEYQARDPYADILAGGTFDSRLPAYDAPDIQERVGLWLLQVTLTCDTPGNLSSAAVSLAVPSRILLPQTTENWQFLLTGTAGVEGSIATALSGLNLIIPTFYAITQPIFLPFGSRITLGVTSTANIDTSLTYWVWAGPRGVKPPGLR